MEPQSRQHRSSPHAAGSRFTLPDGPDREAILVLAPQPFYEDRGTPIALRHVLEALSHLGHSVDVLTYPIGRSVQLPGVRYFRSANPFRWSHVPIGLSVRKVVLDLCLIPAAWRRLQARRYRAIHAVEEAAFPAVALGRLYGVPVVYDMQSSLPEQLARHRILSGRLGQKLLKAAERWLLRRVSVVATSTGLASHVAGAVPGARVREWRFPAADSVITATEVANLRRSLAIPDRVPVVVYSGTFAAYQGLPDLVAAIPAVLRKVPETVFVLVGADGLDGEKLARLTEELVLSGNVRVIERQPREHVPAYLAMADLLVSPRAYGSNLPLKIFDYLAAGKPIVATDVPAHRTLLKGGRAELVEPTAEALARTIADLLLDRERAGHLADEARAYAAGKLGWMGFVRAVAALYDEVSGPRGDGLSTDRAACAAARHRRVSVLG